MGEICGVAMCILMENRELERYIRYRALRSGGVEGCMKRSVCVSGRGAQAPVLVC